jgi:uncharacterized glyoxalase superfamily protein PhnB
MKNTPAGWPRIAVAIFYDDALRAIDWLCRAFGFEVRLKVLTEAGRVQHSELLYGEGVIMVGQAGKAADHGRITRSPQSLGGANTQAVMVYVDDVDLHCARARSRRRHRSRAVRTRLRRRALGGSQLRRA